MSDGGMAANCPARFREADQAEAFAAGEAAERARNVAFLDAYAARMRAIDSDVATNVAALAQSIRTGLAMADPAPLSEPEQGISA